MKKNNTNAWKHEHTLDEAIQETKIGKYQVMLIIFSGFSVMGASLENLSIGYVMPYAKCDLNLTPSQQGVLASISYLGIVSSSYFWGFLTDVWGRQKVLSMAALFGSLFSFISAFFSDFHMFILFRFLAGAMLAGPQTAALSYVSEFHTSTLAPRAVAFASLAPNAVSIFLALPAIFIIPMEWTLHIASMDFKPWRFYMICISAVNLLNGIIFTFMPESPKFLMITNRKKCALKVLKQVYAFNTGEPKETFPVKNIKMDAIGDTLSNTKGFCNVMRLLWAQTKPIFMPPLLKHTWKMCLILFVLFAASYGTRTWAPDFLVQLQNYRGPPKTLCEVIQPASGSDQFNVGCDNLNHDNIFTYEILLVIGIACFITSILSSALLKIISPKILFVVWLTISMIACITLNLFTEFKWTIISFLLFMCFGSCANIAMAVGVNLFPSQYRGMATSFLLSFGRAGSFVWTSIIGLMLVDMCSWIFFTNVAIMSLCIVIFLMIKTSTPKHDQQNEIETTRF